jgi:hypothetical protein
MVMVPALIVYSSWALTVAGAAESSKPIKTGQVFFITDIRFVQTAAIKADTPNKSKVNCQYSLGQAWSRHRCRLAAPARASKATAGRHG